MSVELTVIGIVILAIAIILWHFFPNKYWVAMVLAGIAIMIIGVILLALASFAIVPYVPVRY